MGVVIKGNFGRSRSRRGELYSADVYTTDMSRIRFEVKAPTLHLAHQKVVSSEAYAKLSNVRAIAVFMGAVTEREAYQLPALVCHYRRLDTVQNL